MAKKEEKKTLSVVVKSAANGERAPDDRGGPVCGVADGRAAECLIAHTSH